MKTNVTKTTRQAILQRAASGVPAVEVYAWPLELEGFQNVRSFVDKFATDGNGKLNALVANAGIFPREGYTQAQDGWEVTYVFAIPYLPFKPSHRIFITLGCK